MRKHTITMTTTTVTTHTCSAVHSLTHQAHAVTGQIRITHPAKALVTLVAVGGYSHEIAPLRARRKLLDLITGQQQHNESDAK
jgi:hypothetical protein